MSEKSKKKVQCTKIKPNTDNDQTKINDLIKDRIYRAREIITDTIISVQLYRKYNIFSKKIIVHDELIVVIQGLRKSNNIKNKQVKNIFMKLLNIPIELKILVSEYLMYDFYDGY